MTKYAQKIGITADCSSGLEYAPFEHNVKITRTTINFGNEVLIDGIDITADEFYKRLEESDIIPSTAAPTIGEITRCIDELKQAGCTDIIHFPISFGLSAYGETWQATLPELFDDVNIHVVDTKRACILEGYQAFYAQKMAEAGYNTKEIIKEIERFREQTGAFFVVDDLKYLVKNGRLSSVSGMIGSLVKIKPILELNQDGKISTYEKVRTHTRALDRMIELTLEKTKDAKKVLYYILHSNCLDGAKNLKSDFASKIKNAYQIDITTITPTVGAHIGSGVLGIGYVILDDIKIEL